MKIGHLITVLALVAFDLILIFRMLIGDKLLPLFDAKGMIAVQQHNIIITAVLLMLVAVIPVFIALFFVAWKYRSSNTKARYTPNVDHNHSLQLLWWGILSGIIVILCVINWDTTHRFDPHKPLPHAAKPLTIQVVALNWKWLFIYPEQGIATVNYVAFPEKTPLNFQLTAGNAPMNSFWIPQLGGQMYAMSGMSNTIHLIADTTGEFPGSTAELSGEGFAGMRFTAHSLSTQDFDTWVTSVRQSPQTLTMEEYQRLEQPSEDTPPTFYSSTEDDLYTTIMMSDMKPSEHMHMQKMAEMQH